MKYNGRDLTRMLPQRLAYLTGTSLQAISRRGCPRSTRKSTKYGLRIDCSGGLRPPSRSGWPERYRSHWLTSETPRTSAQPADSAKHHSGLVPSVPLVANPNTWPQRAQAAQKGILRSGVSQQGAPAAGRLSFLRRSSANSLRHRVNFRQRFASGTIWSGDDDGVLARPEIDEESHVA